MEVLITDLDIDQARDELKWRQRFVSDEQRDEALAFAREYLLSHPQKLKQWRDCDPYMPIVRFAENYLFDHGIARCKNPKKELDRIYAQAAAAGWMPYFVIVQAAILKRTLNLSSNIKHDSRS